MNVNKLIYITDPLCSWCYGFSPEISKVIEHFGDQLEFDLIMGGLRPFNTETMTQLGEFLGKHWQQVEERSGQIFNTEILKDTSFVYDTEPPARATVAVRWLKRSVEFEFFKAVQVAFYAENKNTNDVATYLPIVEQFGINPEEFTASFQSDMTKEKVRRDFEQTAQWGVRGFPTLVLQKGAELELLATGYTEASVIIERIETLTKW